MYVCVYVRTYVVRQNPKQEGAVSCSPIKRMNPVVNTESSFQEPVCVSVVERLRLAGNTGTSNTNISNANNVVHKFTLELRLTYAKLLKKSEAYGKDASPIKRSSEDASTSNKRWKSIKLLGSGSFAEVYLVSDQCDRNKQYALKVFNESFNLLGVREATILKSLSSYTEHEKSYFLTCCNSCYLGKRFSLRLELMRCSLYDWMKTIQQVADAPLVSKRIKPIVLRKDQSFIVNPITKKSKTRPIPDMAKVKQVALSLLSACLLLEREGIIHGDIKPENVFLQWNDTNSNTHIDANTSSDKMPQSNPSVDYNINSSLVIKLGDFSNSFHKSEISFDGTVDFQVQSMPYRAPEVLVGCPFGTQIDIWSVGIVILELCLQKGLFHSSSRREYFDELLATFTTFPFLRYTGGKYYNELCCREGVERNESFSYAVHRSRIQSLLKQSVAVPSESMLHLVGFLAGLLHPDPDERLHPLEALQAPPPGPTHPPPRCRPPPPT